jgi:hypothetical protein
LWLPLISAIQVSSSGIEKKYVNHNATLDDNNNNTNNNTIIKIVAMSAQII